MEGWMDGKSVSSLLSHSLPGGHRYLYANYVSVTVTSWSELVCMTHILEMCRTPPPLLLLLLLLQGLSQLCPGCPLRTLSLPGLIKYN